MHTPRLFQQEPFWKQLLRETPAQGCADCQTEEGKQEVTSLRLDRHGPCDFKFEAHHSLDPMETFLRCAVAEPLAGPCVELVCDTIAVALRERCLAGALREVLS